VRPYETFLQKLASSRPVITATSVFLGVIDGFDRKYYI